VVSSPIVTTITARLPTAGLMWKRCCTRLDVAASSPTPIPGGTPPSAPTTASRCTRQLSIVKTSFPAAVPGTRWIIAIAVMSSAVMEVLDTTVVNVSLPHVAGSLSSSVEEATWVLTSYIVANAIILPITGWLANYFGRKRLLMTVVTGFTLSSALCGFAPNLPALIFFRVLQGTHRRRPPADFTGRSAGRISGQGARKGNGILELGNYCGSDSWPNARGSPTPIPGAGCSLSTCPSAF
jgi:hypothetical protein